MCPESKRVSSTTGERATQERASYDADIVVPTRTPQGYLFPLPCRQWKEIIGRFDGNRST
jgi:hypothetical protein